MIGSQKENFWQGNACTLFNLRGVSANFLLTFIYVYLGEPETCLEGHEIRK